MKTYVVTMYREITIMKDIEVTAKSEEDAEQLARDELFKTNRIDLDDGWFEVDEHDCGIDMTTEVEEEDEC